MKKNNNYYNDKYNNEDYYWGLKPSSICLKVLQFKPPEVPLKLLDIGCGEGRNSIFFARNGYQVTAFDLAKSGVEKTKQLAEKVGVNIKTFQADINEFRLEEKYDVLFSTGSLHYIPIELRNEIFGNYKKFTNKNGINMFSVFVNKPFIAPAPEKETNSYKWKSGELLTLYHDWKIEFSIEEIFDCMSSGVHHKHATNIILATKLI